MRLLFFVGGSDFREFLINNEHDSCYKYALNKLLKFVTQYVPVTELSSRFGGI